MIPLCILWLNDASELVNKIGQQKIGTNNAIKAYNNLLNKAEQIVKLRSTSHRQKMLKIFNYLAGIFNGPASEEFVLQGHGLKILMPCQMFSRLPITLAQLNAGNNSENLKSEIWQLLYSLYWSKKLTKNVYKNLVIAIV